MVGAEERGQALGSCRAGSSTVRGQLRFRFPLASAAPLGSWGEGPGGQARERLGGAAAAAIRARRGGPGSH